MTKPQNRKKTKASKGTNIVEEPVVTMEELDQALTKSIEVLTSKWSQFAATHLDALTSVTQRISELKELAAKSATGATTSIVPVSAQPDTR